MRNTQQKNIYQGGFGLIELMVGLVIGLIATLVIMQVFSDFEGQKRSTSGVADTQTNGSIALMNIQRIIQQAGYGLPLPNADFASNSLRCDPVPTFDPDANPLTLNDIGLSPIEIQDGGAAGSDVVTSRHSNTAIGSVPVRVINSSNATTTGMNVVNNIGCNDNDIALIYNGNVCRLVQIDDADGAGNTTEHVKLDNATPAGAPIVDNAQMACMGNWQNYVFDINNNNNSYELRLNGNALVNEVVSLQAQYGVSAAANSNQVGSWVDASGGTWAAPSVDNRNRIKAIRIAIVVRSGLLEKGNVSQACDGAVAGLANVCIWNSDAAPQVVNLNAIPNWQRYRYRVFETIIPLRNMLWSLGAVS